MKNFIQDGTTITVTLSEATKSGQLVIVGDTVGVAVTGGEPGDAITVNTQGVYDLDKGTKPVAFAQGQKVYTDASKDLTENAAGKANPVFVGHAWETSPTTETTVKVKINF